MVSREYVRTTRPGDRDLALLGALDETGFLSWHPRREPVAASFGLRVGCPALGFGIPRADATLACGGSMEHDRSGIARRRATAQRLSNRFPAREAADMEDDNGT